MLVGLGDDPAPLPLTDSGHLSNATLPVAHLIGRMDEVADVVRGLRPPAPLLAAPEHAAGWIHAATLIDRLTRTPHPAPLDLVAALLRLHPDGRTTTGADALPAPVRYALGGMGGLVEPDLARDGRAAWVAAGRTRTVTEVDPALLRLGLGGAGRAHPLDARVRTASKPERYEEDRRGVHTWTSWAWDLRLAHALHQVTADQPTGLRQLGRSDDAWRMSDEYTAAFASDEAWTPVADTSSAAFWRCGLGAYVGWAATIWPADAEHFLVSAAGSVLSAAISTEVEHDAVRVLDALGGHPGRLGRLAGVTLAAGLAAGRPDQRVHAVDAVDRLVRAGRLSAQMLADGVTTFGGAGLLARSAKSWKDLASISPQTSAFVVDTLAATLPHTDRATNGVHAVLAVLEDELLRAGRPTPPTLQPWLRGFTGSSKASSDGCPSRGALTRLSWSWATSGRQKRPALAGSHHRRRVSGSRRRAPAQRDVTVQRLLVLVLGAHMATVDPAVVLPMPSSAVPVPRLMIWRRPLPTSFSRHCWLLPPFQAAAGTTAPLAVLPQLSRTKPLVRLTMRYQPLPRSTSCHCRLVLPSQFHCLRLEPEATLPPLSSTRPVVTLPIRT